MLNYLEIICLKLWNVKIQGNLQEEGKTKNCNQKKKKFKLQETQELLGLGQSTNS